MGPNPSLVQELFGLDFFVEFAFNEGQLTS